MAVIRVEICGGRWAAVGNRKLRRSRQIVTSEQRIKIRIGLERACARVGVYQAWICDRISAGVQADGVVGGVHDSQRIALRQNGVLKLDSRLQIVMALGIRYIGPQSQIGEPSILANGLELEATWREVGERITAGIVIVLILSGETGEGKQGGRIQ